MKTVVLANQKGGVGKSAIAVQLAYFLHIIKGKRVIVIDMDHQRNTSKAICTGGLALISQHQASQLLSTRISTIDKSDFVLVSADNDNLLKLERQAGLHNEFATNLQSFLKAIDQNFDYCIIDTNPNPDIRQLACLVVSDFVLSPLQLNQEAIDGIGDLLNHDRLGIQRIKSVLNPKLKLIGILPNLVEPTPFQRENFRALCTHFAKLLIPMETSFAAIKKTTAIAEAQAVGEPIWKLGKTSSRDAWIQIKPVFEKIASLMETD